MATSILTGFCPGGFALMALFECLSLSVIQLACLSSTLQADWSLWQTAVFVVKFSQPLVSVCVCVYVVVCMCVILQSELRPNNSNFNRQYALIPPQAIQSLSYTLTHTHTRTYTVVNANDRTLHILSDRHFHFWGQLHCTHWMTNVLFCQQSHTNSILKGPFSFFTDWVTLEPCAVLRLTKYIVQSPLMIFI